MALLDKAVISHESERLSSKSTIDSLIIVHHRDLTFQFISWIKAILKALPLSTSDTIVQGVVRGDSSIST
jgi:hypothetical protein